jgi:predicted AAA+ superfamily ATPase
MPNDSDLKKIIDEWQNWAKKILKSKFLRKDLKIKFIANNAIALIGVRRSGKTFYALELATKISKNFFYINFEDPFFISNNTTEVLDRLIEIYTQYELKEPSLLVFDEIQNIEAWERWVRKIIDLKKYQIIITGSSAQLLSSEIASSLTGRAINYNIWPLSFNEFLAFKKINKELNENEYLGHVQKYLLEGAFPEPCLATDQESRETQLKQYVEDILQKDIVKRYEIRNVKNLYLLASYYFSNLSSLHSSQSIKKALNINNETAADYSKYMEDAFLIFGVDRYHPNLKVQIRDPRKIYIIDTGLRNAYSRSASPDLGKLAENMVFVELKRRNKEIYYYKEKQEVDFIVTKNFKAKAAIQVCYSNLAKSETYTREINSLVACLEDLKLKEGLILSKNHEEIIKIKNKTITIMPLYKWFLVGESNKSPPSAITNKPKPLKTSARLPFASQHQDLD